MKKVLYILSENLSIGVIRSQVISHIDFFHKEKLARFEILFCYWSKEEFNKTKLFLKQNPKLGIKVHFIKIFRPLLFFLNNINLKRINKKILEIGTIDFIHARTDFCVCLLKKLNQKQTKVIWDCRGDSASELDHFKCVVFRKSRKDFLNTRFFLAMKISSKIICVSNFVKRKIEEKNLDMNKEIFKIPSVASKNFFFFDYRLRDEIRKKFLINKETIVFIYTGGFQKYQNFEQTLRLYDKIRLKKKNTFFFILTQDLDMPKVLYNRNDIIIKSVEFNQVNKYLNAADYAFCIRTPNNANKAGSPTKLAEYCLSGLNIITSKGMHHYFEEFSESRNIIYFDELKNNLLKNNLKNRKKIANFYVKKISRESFYKVLKKLYD